MFCQTFKPSHKFVINTVSKEGPATHLKQRKHDIYERFAQIKSSSEFKICPDVLWREIQIENEQTDSRQRVNRVRLFGSS